MDLEELSRQRIDKIEDIKIKEIEEQGDEKSPDEILEELWDEGF